MSPFRKLASCCQGGAQIGVYAAVRLVERSADVAACGRVRPTDVHYAICRGHELRTALELAEVEHEFFIRKLVLAGRAIGASLAVRHG